MRFVFTQSPLPTAKVYQKNVNTGTQQGNFLFLSGITADLFSIPWDDPKRQINNLIETLSKENKSLSNILSDLLSQSRAGGETSELLSFLPLFNTQNLNKKWACFLRSRNYRICLMYSFTYTLKIDLLILLRQSRQG